MSQSDILDLLEKKKAPLTSKEIAEILKVRQESIITSLRKLLKYDEIKAKRLTEKDAKKLGLDPKIVFSHVRIFWVE